MEPEERGKHWKKMWFIKNQVHPKLGPKKQIFWDPIWDSKR